MIISLVPESDKPVIITITSKEGVQEIEVPAGQRDICVEDNVLSVTKKLTKTSSQFVELYKRPVPKRPAPAPVPAFKRKEA
jgi:hypothetical protein